MSKLREYFIKANSFAAPFFSDDSSSYQKGCNPDDALEQFAREYSHPAGLYAAACYESADAYHKNKKPLARWLCNHEAAKQKATEGRGSYSFLSERPGRFRIDGEWFDVPEPKKGNVVTA